MVGKSMIFIALFLKPIGHLDFSSLHSTSADISVERRATDENIKSFI
jgi:Tfp pilus assembly pilus retraction ATPase PilT